MNHDTLKEKILLLQDNELSEAEKEEVNSHIKSCSECKETVKLLKASNKILSSIPEPEHSQKLTLNVMKSVAEMNNKPEFGFVDLFTPQWITPVVSFACVALLFIFITTTTDTSTTTNNAGAVPSINTGNVLLAHSSEAELDSFFKSETTPNINLLFEINEEEI